MAFKAVFLLVAVLLSLATASHARDEFKEKAVYSKIGAPAPSPVKAPTPVTPVVKPPAPVTKPPVVSPPVAKPPAPVTKPPVAKPPAPVTKPPVVSPPVAKPPAPTPSLPPLPPVRSRADCIPLCAERCKLHSRKNLCARACVTCCDRCKCVPPGTYGNRERCGKCYTGMTTRNNKPKCP